MMHYAIYHTWRHNSRKLTPVAHRRAEKMIEKIEAAGQGPLLHYLGNADAVAAQLSRNPAIENVIVIHVTETPVGVWRKGRKS